MRLTMKDWTCAFAVPELEVGDALKHVQLQLTYTTAQQNCRRRYQQVVGGGRGSGDGGRGTGIAGGTAGGRGAQKPLPMQHSRSIYVGNLPHGCDIAEVGELAVPYGLLESVKYLQTCAPLLCHAPPQRFAHAR